MLRLVVRLSWVRWLVGMACALSLPLWLPDPLATRLWVLAGVALLAPWLVIGQDQKRRDWGIRTALRMARRTPRLVCLELVPPLTVVITGALLGTGGRVAPALSLIAWAMLWVIVADALDRRAASAGGAWTPVVALAMLWASMPVILAPWFGVTSASPWLSSLTVGLHPVGSALDAAGLSTLQDPWFYAGTLSGVVEAHPISWLWGLVVLIAWAVVALIWSIRAAGQPERSAP
ncbi:MAG: hypothetical protein ACE366_27800 [Bradymonadia bacterium]